MRLINALILISSLGVSSCIDPFVPETASYEDLIFIECLLSNDTSRVQAVKIALASPVISEYGSHIVLPPKGVSGANVRVAGDDGHSYPFVLAGPGRYEAEQDFIPVPGKAYKLIVNHAGNSFESDFETMKASPPIDSISFRHKIERVSEMGDVYDGYRFYSSNHNNQEAGPSYYRWEPFATYYFRIPYDATHIWDGRTQIPATNSEVRYCWSSNFIKGIFTGNTEGLSENRISESPLHFQSQYGDALSIRYSLNVKQYAINRSAWEFWDDMQRQVSQNGGMYDTQPFRVQGNIRCTTDPELFVAGVFEVAGYTEKRIFLNRPSEFDIIPVVCNRDTIGTRDLPWYRVPRGSYITFDVNAGVYFYSNPRCYDCTLKGGSLEKPAFWEYDN